MRRSTVLSLPCLKIAIIFVLATLRIMALIVNDSQHNDMLNVEFLMLF